MDDIDRTFEKLKKSPYGELKGNLLEKFQMIDISRQERSFSPDYKETIERHGWTMEEYIEEVDKRYRTKRTAKGDFYDIQ